MNVMLPKLMCIKKCMKTKFHCIMRVSKYDFSSK